MRSQQIQYPQFDFINPTTAPNYLAQQGWSYQACQQSVEFVAVLDAVLPSVAMIPSLSVALADAIQAPLAPKLSYASVAKSDEHEAISGRGRAKETIFSACGRDVRRPAVCGRDVGRPAPRRQSAEA